MPRPTSAVWRSVGGATRRAEQAAASQSATDPATRSRAAIIDLVATDLADLLRQLDGCTVATGQPAPNDSVRLATAIMPWSRRSSPTREAGLLAVPKKRPEPRAAADDDRRLRPAVRIHESGLRRARVIGGVSLLLALWGLQMLPGHVRRPRCCCSASPSSSPRRSLPRPAAHSGIQRRRSRVRGWPAADRRRRAGLRHPSAADRRRSGDPGPRCAGLVTMAASAAAPVVSSTALARRGHRRGHQIRRRRAGPGRRRERLRASARPLRVGERVRIARVSGSRSRSTRPPTPPRPPRGMHDCTSLRHDPRARAARHCRGEFAAHPAREYQRAVVFQPGAWRVKGPGPAVLIPGLQQMVRIDPRIVVMDVPSQIDLARQRHAQGQRGDLLPRRRSAARGDPGRELPRRDQPAQTTLRAVLGKHTLDEMLSERERLNLTCSPRQPDRRLGHQPPPPSTDRTST